MAKEYDEETARLTKLFYEDSVLELGIKNNPKVGKAWEMAWDNGHSSGLYDVYNCLIEYADLIK